jgi:prepilin-type N-terminal cleavage/methylation domain-containing protein
MKRGTHARKPGGFTLLELIAVLAVMSILASLIAPNIVRSIGSAKRDLEIKTLGTFHETLLENIKQNQYIPDSTEWDSALAVNCAIPISRIRINDAGYTRRYLSHPDFFAIGSGIPVAGYHQNAALTAGTAPSTDPLAPRVMIVSGLNSQLPTTAMTAALFTQIWDQSGQPADWTEAPFLIIERIDMGPSFQQTGFTRDNRSSNNPRVLIGTYTRILTNGSAIFSAYLLLGTPLKFYDGAGTPAYEHLMIVTGTNSYTYRSPDWVSGFGS